MNYALPSHLEWIDDPFCCRAFARERQGEEGCTPKAIVKPLTTEDVVSLLAWANSTGTAVVPASSTGVRRRGDTVPTLVNTVVADLSGMKKLVHVDSRDKIAIIEPGIDFGSIDPLLAPHGLRAFRPLAPRAGKSVIASYLEREPILDANNHWDIGDPFGGTGVVLGNGKYAPTGGAAVEGTLPEQLARGHRQMASVGPVNLDILRVLQGAQGSLGIMTWAAVYCERIPVLEESWFLAADILEPVVDIARDILMRRLGNQVFIVDRVQLAMMLSNDQATFQNLVVTLPRWILVVSLSAQQYAPAHKMDWQLEQLLDCAKRRGLHPEQTLAGHNANELCDRMRSPQRVFFRDSALGTHLELFFLQQLDKVSRFTTLVRTCLDEQGFFDSPLGTYIQPMAQGTYCHIEFTLPYQLTNFDKQQKLAAVWRDAAQRCANSGGFFSRPYGDWLELAFKKAVDTKPLLSMTKSILDPNNVMNPGRFPY